MTNCEPPAAATTLAQHGLGCWKVVPKPFPEELRDVYRSRYCPNPERQNQYSYMYSDGELEDKRMAADETMRYARVFGGFPVDLFLLNEYSNYERDRSCGRAAHFARVAFGYEYGNDLLKRRWKFGAAVLTR